MSRITLLLCLMAVFTISCASGADGSIAMSSLPETTEVPATGDFVDDASSTIEIPAGSSFAVGAPAGTGEGDEAGLYTSIGNNSSNAINSSQVVSGGNESISATNSIVSERSAYNVSSYFRFKPTYEVDKYFRIKPMVRVDEWPFVCDVV